MNLVFIGTPFQKTTASVPKLLPLIVMMKGTLLTGTLSGVNVVIAGGEKTTALNGSPLLFTPLPHPMVSRLASTRLTYRIATSCRFRKMPTRRKKAKEEGISLSVGRVPVKMKEFAYRQDFADSGLIKAARLRRSPAVLALKALGSRVQFFGCILGQLVGSSGPSMLERSYCGSESGPLRQRLRTLRCRGVPANSRRDLRRRSRPDQLGNNGRVGRNTADLRSHTQFVRARNRLRVRTICLAGCRNRGLSHSWC